MNKAACPVLPEKRDGRVNFCKTVNYSCVSGSSRNHHARTMREAWLNHPIREFPQFKQDLSVEYAADCDVPDATAIPGDSGDDTSATCRPAPGS
jgi:hypothetical protein